MKPAYFLLAFALPFAACDDDAITTNELPATKQLDFTEFTIDVPANWNELALQGIDSHVGGITMDAQQEAYFDLGWYSNPLDVESGTHRIEYITIDGKEAKVVRPVEPGRGTTGVYIGNLNDGGLIRFEMHGDDLSAENQQQLLDAIMTLDFK